MSGVARLLQRLALVAFFLVSIVAALTGRVIWEGQAELTASDSAFDAGDLRLALEHARRGATLYAPGAPYVERAYERLIAIALGAEAAGQPKTGSYYRSARTSLYCGARPTFDGALEGRWLARWA